MQAVKPTWSGSFEELQRMPYGWCSSSGGLSGDWEDVQDGLGTASEKSFGSQVKVVML